MNKIVGLVILAGLLLSLTACAGGLPTATPTAIPLAATATPTPRPTQALETATQQPPAVVATGETPPPATIAPSPGTSSELDTLLAERCAQGFLTRLARGEPQSAFDLYLSQEALEGEAGQLLAYFVESNRRLADAGLLEFRQATANSYEARSLLRWAGGEQDEPATQTMTLTIAPQRGLWLIDDITLGDLRGIEATPTPKPASGRGQQQPKLRGALAFQVSSGGAIYVVNTDGSGLRLLTDGLDPAWSPDGKHLAFTRWRDPWGVYLLDPGTGSEERVVDGIQLKEVAWSPDGSRIAFTINISSNEPITICFFGRCFTLPPFSFGQMWMANLNSNELLSLPLDERAVHAPAWSPTQERIVYAGDRGLAWLDLEDMEKGRFEGSSAWDTSPSFAPDGRQIAFMGRVHNRWEIFGMNADGSGRRQLTSSDPKVKEAPSNVAPAWSPDGKFIAFLSNRDGPWRIYVMEADGSQQRPMFGDKLDELGLRYEWATERVLSWRK